MYQTSFRNGRIRCLILLKQVYKKVKQKRYKVQVLLRSTRNEADFSVFNLRTTQYIKCISQKTERRMILFLDSHPLGLRGPSWPKDLYFSKVPLLSPCPHFTKAPLCVAVEMIRNCRQEITELRIRDNQQKEMDFYWTTVLLCANLNRREEEREEKYRQSVS